MRRRREIEIELYWKLRKTIFYGQNLNPRKKIFCGQREYHITGTRHFNEISFL
jgi:hypothetical protein